MPLIALLQPYWDILSWLQAPSQSTRAEATMFHYVALVTVATPFAIVCYLARRPGTRPYRLVLALLFAPIQLLLMAAVRWAPPKELPFNVFLTMAGIQVAIRMLELGYSPEGAKRIDEATLGSLRKTGKQETIQATIADTADLAFTVRGVKYEFGRGVKLSRDWRPLNDRTAWMLRTLTHYIIPNFLVFDFTNSYFIRSPEIYSIVMEEIDFRQLDWPQKTVIKFFLATMVITGLSFVYHIIALSCVAILDMAPDEWPVIFGRPWTARSLHAFWGVEWHQILRRTFLVTGGYPLGFFFGRAGIVLGVFMSSGLLHSIMLIADGEPMSWATFFFFTIQALGFVIERIWRRISGRRVGGILGNVWVVVWLAVAVEQTGIASTWLRRGAASVKLVPAWMSPSNLALNVVYPDFTAYTIHPSNSIGSVP
ncbi:hypothetical protein FRB95_008159 [Tulasnella sp. JGI-2019a]|nr:hypothetical protein FRB95_008159 [Tulasnella sp. JGI-2019a]